MKEHFRLSLRFADSPTRSSFPQTRKKKKKKKNRGARDWNRAGTCRLLRDLSATSIRLDEHRRNGSQFRRMIARL